MKLEELIAQLRAQIAAKLAERNKHAEKLAELRSAETTDEAAVTAERSAKDALDAEIDVLEARIKDLTAEHERDQAVARMQAQYVPVNPQAPTDQRVAYDQVARVGSEKRTYNKGDDARGAGFLVDVARAFSFADPGANERLARHMAEEQVERGGKVVERAAGTSAFAGLVVPQYLVDEFAPLARAGRPFADACRKHDLPAEGMVFNIGKVTTGTSVDDQAAENAAVSETDIDDTLLPINVRTAAGSQTVSRQALERGTGIEDTTLADLIGAYHTNLDTKLLNVATVGLSAVATAITYTDAAPSATALYPKLVGASAATEAALLNAAVGDVIAVMHSRRWYWLQTQLTSTWPMFGQPGVAAQLGGANYGERYGSGFRGILPNGVPVIVDNNVATTKGGGTEDEIYFVAQSEAHLWEDPSAPMLIRAEQPSAKKLGVDLVVYGYYAQLFNRRVHAQRIGGTGLAAPTF